MRRAPVTVALAASLLGCTDQTPARDRVEERPPLVLTLAPSGALGPLPRPADRYPDGSRLVRMDRRLPDAPGQVLTDGMSAAGGARVSPDGMRILFVGAVATGDRYAVHEIAADGSDRRVVAARDDGDCGLADYLPDGRIVYAASLPGPSPVDRMAQWALFVGEPDEPESGARITFGGGVDVDPSVLPDGRIVYATWQPHQDREGGRFVLFTVHPDGTGVAPLHGSWEATADCLLPRWGASGGVGTLWMISGGRARAAEWAAPMDTGEDLPVEGEVVRAAVPLRGGDVLACAGEAGIVALTPDGPQAIGPAPPTFAVVDAAEITSRRPPQGQLSMVRVDVPYGRILALDARAPGGEAARARLRRAPARWWDAGDSGTELGSVDLAEDGSFFVHVPHDTPLLLDVLADDGSALVTGRTPFWVRPNETRGCVGCHEHPETAPPNRLPLAAPRGAVGLGVPGGKAPDNGGHR